MQKSFILVVGVFCLGLASLVFIVTYNLNGVVSDIEYENDTGGEFFRKSALANSVLLEIKGKTGELFATTAPEEQTQIDNDVAGLFTRFDALIADLQDPKYQALLGESYVAKEGADSISVGEGEQEVIVPETLGDLFASITDESASVRVTYNDVYELATKKLKLETELEPANKELNKLLRETLYLQSVDPKAYNNFARGAITVMYTRSNRDVKFAGDAKFTSGYEDLSALALGASDQSKIDAVKKAFDEVYSRARVLVSMSNDSAFFNRKVEHIVHMLGDLERQVSRVFALHQAQLIKNTNRTTTQAQIMAVVIVLICMALAYFIARRIIVRLYDLVRRMDDIAQGEGDLTAKVEIEGRDEITRVAKSFNEFTEKMRSSFIRVFEAVDRVNQVAQELVETNRGVAQRVNVQEQSIDAVATAVEELSHTSRDVAETTESASNSAKDSDQHANQGQAVVSEAVSAINILADEISRNAEVIDNLRSQSESISAIVDVIQGIAEQTNLLALNAAIEAARAGEQGRGFAVVADEVRMLASRTHESTEEIVSMIKSIQDSAQTAASEMSSSVESARSCVVQVETAGQALDSIVHGIDHITGLNAQIASASEEQRVTTETVSRDVISIRDNAEETSEASKQAETLCLGLSEEVSQVKSVLSQFKY